MNEVPKDWDGLCPGCRGNQFKLEMSATNGLLNSRRLYDVECENGVYECGFKFKVVIL